ncbi:MAG: transposase, partial [Rikenellaceae bacterium]
PKQTAHGLITKAAEMLDRLNTTLKDAVLSEDYVHFDETYHTLIDKQADGGSRKAYFWVALANKSKLIHFFYDNGSRSKKVFTDYLPSTYKGAVQSDGYSSYKSVEGWDYPKAKRLGCVQHCKRKFFDIETQTEAKEIIGLYNQLYHVRHSSPKERWVEESILIFEQLEQKLRSIERDEKHNSNTILLRGVAYCINELES